jgi:hypothetical protein
VRELYLPKYNSLSIEACLEFATGYPDVWKYLPMEREIAKLPRYYIVNMIHSVVGEPFKAWA